MQSKKSHSIYAIGIIVIFWMLSFSCEKEDNSNPTNGKTTALFNSQLVYGTMTDQDDNIYKTITIGTQTWMAENLRTTKYNDGSIIPTGEISWQIIDSGTCCTYNNTTNLDTIASIGRLYNWYAVNTQKLAPDNWHVATYNDWTTLIEYLGGEFIAADKLKEIGTEHWLETNENVTNASGFTALPSGSTYNGSVFFGSTHFCNIWTATEMDSTFAFNIYMTYLGPGASRVGATKTHGFSVRCVKN
jgi:uncharacterized protein (TIGR02145 family)